VTAAEWRASSREARAARVLPIVARATLTYPDVPLDTALAVIRQESDFSPWATATHPGDLARGGAFGLMQMTLQTARSLGYSGPAGDPAQLTGLYDPDTNVMLGVRYLSDLLTATNHNVAAAVSAYNAGLSAERAGDGKRTTNDPKAPFINQAYVDKVLSYADGYGAAALLAIVVALIAFLIFRRR
jgi:soluble lytic murein transglycosylase-like protein